MNVLIFGATGFIGNAIFNSLVSDYSISIASREPIDGFNNWKKIDFAKINPNDYNWADLLQDIDLVINAVGIIDGDFNQIQNEVPISLFKYCSQNNLKIINISAIGAERNDLNIPFLKSKREADNFLLAYNNAKIVYPGIVIGKFGKSSQFFKEISTLPLIPLLNTTNPPFVHISQLCGLIKNIINDFDSYPKQIFAISESEAFSDILEAISGKKKKFSKIPKFISDLIFKVFPKMRIGIFNKDLYQMMCNISSSDYNPTFEKVSSFIEPNLIKLGNNLQIQFAIFAISFVWVWSGISSLASWNVSMQLMNEIGANEIYSKVFIILGSIVDISLGILIFNKNHFKLAILFQTLFLITYTIILSFLAPNYWLHPFGVLSKNLPLLALSYIIYNIKNK